jgi:hypothetical protein
MKSGLAGEGAIWRRGGADDGVRVGVMLSHGVLTGGDLEHHLNRCGEECSGNSPQSPRADITQPGEPALPRVAVVWSGTLAGGEGDGFGVDPRTWLPSGRRVFAEQFGETAARLRARGLHPVLRPHARHAIGDHHAARNFAADPAREVDGAAVLLDVGAMLARSMLAALEDHTERVLSSAATYPPGRLAGVVLSGVDAGPAQPDGRSTDVDEGPALPLVPLSAARGMDPGVIARIAARNWIDRSEGLNGVPLVLLDDGRPGSVEQDLDLLRRAGLPL